MEQRRGSIIADFTITYIINQTFCRIMNIVRFLFYLIICISSSVVPLQLTLLDSPRSVNAVNGSSVVFECTVAEAVFIVYRVNETFAGDQTAIDKGFLEADDHETSLDGSSLRLRNLTATALVQYNNTNVTCIGINSALDPSKVSSDPAILLVQGPLSSVVDISYSFIDSSTVNISWNPPFTLPGIDITGYNISATSNGTTTNYFTSNSYYELSLTDITDSPCNEIIITVSGYNGLDGENTTLTGIYLSALPSHSIESVSHTLDEDLYLSLSIYVNELCVGQYPSEIKVVLLSNITEDISLPKQSFMIQVLEVINVTQLQQNTEYTVIISYTNQAGDFNFSNTLQVHFYTYDLVSVHVLNSSDSRVCLECSFSSFSTDNAGCTVELVSSTNTISSMETFSKPNNTNNSMEGCVYIHGLTSTELFHITVKDQRDMTREFNFNLLIEPITPNVTTPFHICNTSNTTTADPLSPTHPPLHSIEPTGTDPSTTRENSSDNITIIVVPVTVLAILLILTIVIPVVIYLNYMKRKKRQFDVPVDNNPAYTSIMMGRQPANTDRSIPTEHNPAYEQVTVAKSHYENVIAF